MLSKMDPNTVNQISDFVHTEIDVKTEPETEMEEFYMKAPDDEGIESEDYTKMEIFEPVVNIEFVAVKDEVDKIEDIKGHIKGKNISEYLSVDFNYRSCSSSNQMYVDISQEIKNTVSQNQYFIQEKHIHNDTKRYKCNLCEKSFNWKTELDCHFIIHTDERPFACSICNKSFRLKHHLSTHMIIHNIEKLYKCDVCQKEFSYKNALNGHKLIHSGEKPHPCDQCSLRFRQKNDLVKHKRVHSGEKPFKCDVCNRAFTNKSQLIRHRRIHTGEKPYNCDICNKLFTHLSSLSKHKQAHRQAGQLSLKLKFENS